MDKKVRAGLCAASGLLTLLLFKQSFLVSLLVSSTLFFFLDSSLFASKSHKQNNELHKDPDNSNLLPHDTKKTFASCGSNTELVETLNSGAQIVLLGMSQESVYTETEQKCLKFSDIEIETEKTVYKDSDMMTSFSEIVDKAPKVSIEIFKILNTNIQHFLPKFANRSVYTETFQKWASFADINIGTEKVNSKDSETMITSPDQDKVMSLQFFEILNTKVLQSPLVFAKRSVYTETHHKFAEFADVNTETEKIKLKDSETTTHDHDVLDRGNSKSVEFCSEESLDDIPSALLPVDSPPANFIKVSTISFEDSSMQSTFWLSPQISLSKYKPLTALFLSLTDLNFADVFGPSSFLENFVEVYIDEKISTHHFNDRIFHKLYSCIIATYISDFIILILDFSELPDLQHSDLLLRYLTLIKEIDRPLFILHKTSEIITYEYSFKRVTGLLESLWASDRILFHEEISNNIETNSEKLEQIKDQMNDNLFDSESFCDFENICKSAFENAVEKLLLIQNSRKRELLIKSEIIRTDEMIICKSEIEANWKITIRENCQESPLKNLIYVSPAQYHIDNNISSTIYSILSTSISDELVKVSIFSNLPPDELSHLYLSELSYCFAKNKDDTLLILPSSRAVSTSASNHLNTQQFNSVFLSKFMERLSDCIIISLFYNKQVLVQPADHFEGLSSMLKIRKLTKPMLILYQFEGQGDMSDYLLFFKKAVKEFDQLYCSWTGNENLKELNAHENINEGIYAFDQNKQIIHRLVVSSSELVWKWYNGVLYKIMFNAVKKFERFDIVHTAKDAFKQTLSECVRIIEDENEVHPEIDVGNYMEKSWKALSLFSITVAAELSPMWLIEARG